MRIAVSPREKWTENGNENEQLHENQYVLMEKVFFRPNDKQNHQTVVMEREKAREKKNWVQHYNNETSCNNEQKD